MTRQNELIPFVFQDTGVEVLIRKVSPYLALEVQKALPAPKPPAQKVNYGSEEQPEWRDEPNPAHPDHLQALRDYNVLVESKMRRLMIKRGVVLELSEEQQAALAELRAFYQEEFGQALDPDDKVAYITYLAIGTEDDLNELLEAITRRSQPTQEAQELAKASFQG